MRVSDVKVLEEHARSLISLCTYARGPYEVIGQVGAIVIEDPTISRQHEDHIAMAIYNLKQRFDKMRP